MSRLECFEVDDGGAEASVVLLDPRPFRPFKSSEEYLYAMKEDLAEWLQRLYPQLSIDVDNFLVRLEDGVALCKHANNVRRTALAYAEKLEQRGKRRRRFSAHWDIPDREVLYRPEVKPGSFFARDNVHNFITWCRLLGIYECLLFETDDLVLRKNEKSFILCLLEVARRGAKFGMPAPLLVQFEKEIDRELAKDQHELDQVNGDQETKGAGGGHLSDDDDDDDEDEDEEDLLIEYGPQAQIVTNDLRSLDEMVRDLVESCSCPTQFPMIRVSEGKYRIGDTKMLIFVRVLRNHVMVRVGGGWDTLSHYLEKHDPCRCRSGHRVTIASRLSISQNSRGTTQMAVSYERSNSSPPMSRRSSGASTGAPSSRKGSLAPGAVLPSRSRQRSPSPSTRFNANRSQSPHGYGSNFVRSGSGRFYGAPGGYLNSAPPPTSSPHQLPQSNLDSLESYDSGVGGFGHPSPGTRRRSSGVRGIRSPDEVLAAGVADGVNSGDSSSEVSDEGYRTGVNKGDTEPDEERPDSSCTQVSQGSSGESGVSIETGQRRRSQETRSRIPMLATGAQQRTPKTVQFQKQLEHQPPRRSVSRSNSVSSETGNAFQRNTFGRHSLRSKNASLTSSELERLHRPRASLGSQPTPKYSTATWNGRNNRRERPTLNAETFQTPGTRGRPVQNGRTVSRATSSSPHSRRRYFGTSVTSTPVSPETARPRAPAAGTPEIVPMLRDMLTSDGDNEDSILKKLEDIINQYKARVENLAAEGPPSGGQSEDCVDDSAKVADRPRLGDRRGSLDAGFSPIPVRTARRDTLAHSPSKIPMPLFYRQKQQETCL